MWEVDMMGVLFDMFAFLDLIARADCLHCSERGAAEIDPSLMLRVQS